MEPVLAFELLLPGRGQGNRVQALHQQLRSAILDGRLAAASPLPSTRQLALALGVARNTVIAAYDLLIAEGYAMPRVGSRARVAPIAARRPGPGAMRAPPLADARIHPRWQQPLLRAAAQTGLLPAPDFRLGIPEHRLFPHGLWRRLYGQALRAWSRHGFDYPPTEGTPELRSAIAQHVAFTRAVACSSAAVMVTAGAQQAFDLVARLLVIPGQTRVAVEEPGYPPLRAAFLAAGAVLLPIPVDAEGLCVAHLPTDVQIICVTPSHQSPTGAALSMPRRAALLAFAQRHGAVVIEDDYDGEFRFGDRPLDALQTLDRDGLVFYIGTFSKSLFPALRKGFVVAPDWARERLVTIKRCADGHCDAVTESVLATFIRDGHLARHVRRLRPLYAARRRALLEGLHQHLSPWLEPIASEAGLHLAARVRDPAHAPQLFAEARRCVPGAQSTAEYAMGPLEHPALAFGYGVIDAAAIGPALAKLRRALQR